MKTSGSLEGGAPPDAVHSQPNAARECPNGSTTSFARQYLGNGNPTASARACTGRNDKRAAPASSGQEDGVRRRGR